MNGKTQMQFNQLLRDISECIEYVSELGCAEPSNTDCRCIVCRAQSIRGADLRDRSASGVLLNLLNGSQEERQ
jgi:hypothetical protein